MQEFEGIRLVSKSNKIELRASESGKGLEIDSIGYGQFLSIQRNGRELATLDANNSLNGRFAGTFSGRVLIVEGTPVNAVASALITTQGDNKDLKYTAKTPGEDGDNITIEYVVDGLETPLSVSLSGTVITVNVKTTAAGAADSTANEIKAELEGDEDIAALIKIELAEGSTGEGKPGTMAVTPLANGVNGTVGVASEMLIDENYIYRCVAANTINGQNWRRIALGVF